MVLLFSLVFISCVAGFSLIDPENFIPANSLVTPTHIQPEWYFLFAYAILRSVPNKLGGVVLLLLSVLSLFLFRVKANFLFFRGFIYNPLLRAIYWIFIINFLLLT
jgi:ubiquinol-cytochrome c reductase cytochrome b subunit